MATQTKIQEATQAQNSVTEVEGKAQHQQPSAFKKAMDAWVSYFQQHRNRVIYTLVGFVIAAGFLIVGFWPTLLLIIFTAVGMFLGSYKDGDKKTVGSIRRGLNRLGDWLDG